MLGVVNVLVAMWDLKSWMSSQRNIFHPDAMLPYPLQYDWPCGNVLGCQGGYNQVQLLCWVEKGSGKLYQGDTLYDGEPGSAELVGGGVFRINLWPSRRRNRTGGSCISTQEQTVNTEQMVLCLALWFCTQAWVRGRDTNYLAVSCFQARSSHSASR